MTVYERVDEAGVVVERVQPIEWSYEDTRLGLAALDGGRGWRVAGQEQPAEPDPEPGPRPRKK